MALYFYRSCITTSSRAYTWSSFSPPRQKSAHLGFDVFHNTATRQTNIFRRYLDTIDSFTEIFMHAVYRCVNVVWPRLYGDITAQ